MPMFKKIVIIGCGLIGSSLARCIRQHDLADMLVVVEKDKEIGKRVIELDLADETETRVDKALDGADFVIVSVPMGAYSSVALGLNKLEAGAIITDVGSVKQSAIKDLKNHIPAHAHFVPGHPIAGTEFSGPEAGFAELFQNRWCILTPLPQTELRPVERVVKFWEICGAQTEIMDAKRHDLILAITSHLPHLIAFTIVGTATDLQDDTKNDVIKFSASGFRDFTRIAASDPTMWRDVFLNNKEAILEILQRFDEDLTSMRRAIRKGDGQHLFDFFSRTRAVRKDVIEAGQAAYVYPDDQSEPVVEKKSVNP